ncbi:MAG: hypothetical protein OEY49_13060, partial [Candidatus Heimdallarchaeota archaeon]|nr:hypothetical protein [Candidatus Heimdallarchaeota archaeon]
MNKIEKILENLLRSEKNALIFKRITVAIIISSLLLVTSFYIGKKMQTNTSNDQIKSETDPENETPGNQTVSYTVMLAEQLDNEFTNNEIQEFRLEGNGTNDIYNNLISTNIIKIDSINWSVSGYLLNETSPFSEPPIYFEFNITDEILYQVHLNFVNGLKQANETQKPSSVDPNNVVRYFGLSILYQNETGYLF